MNLKAVWAPWQYMTTYQGQRPQLGPVPVCVGGLRDWGVIAKDNAIYGPETHCPISRARLIKRAVGYRCPGCSGYHGPVPQWARRAARGH